MASAQARWCRAGRATIIDGDTIEIRGERIRLDGIDAPESGQTCEADGQPWRCGQQAALALADKIGAANITCTDRGSESHRLRDNQRELMRQGAYLSPTVEAAVGPPPTVTVKRAAG